MVYIISTIRWQWTNIAPSQVRTTRLRSDPFRRRKNRTGSSLIFSIVPYEPLLKALEPFQCTLDPCDALGRARDELYTMLNEKEKVQSQSQTRIGELQASVGQTRDAQERMELFLKQMERRIRSVEQPGLTHTNRFDKAHNIIIEFDQFGLWSGLRCDGANVLKGLI